MAFLTSRTLASGVTGEDLFHIVITGDTSQNSAGSSYKAKINQILGLMTSEPTVFSSGVTANTVTIGGTTLLESDGLCLKKLCISDTLGTVKDAEINETKAGRGGGDKASNTTFSSSGMSSNTTGEYLTSMGDGALASNTTGNDNSAFGYKALSSVSNGERNIAFGSQSLESSYSSDNIAIGYQSSQYSTNALFTIAIGSTALQNNNGDSNIAIGDGTLYNNTTGIDNVGIGYQVMTNNIIGLSNVSIGNFGLSVNNGDNNTSIGYQAGASNINGDSNTFLGFNSDCIAYPNLTNSTAVGANTQLQQSNTVILGNSADVGINTSTPTSKLDIVGTFGYNQFRMRTSYQPSGTTDTNGNVGDVAYDNDYIYIKTISGWGRTVLSYTF